MSLKWKSKALSTSVHENRKEHDLPVNQESSRFITNLLIGVFFFSGFSALLYQVAWQRLLTVHYGVGASTVTTIVTVYMLGLGLGSLIGGALSKKYKNLVGIYCSIEGLIAFFGLISLPVLTFLGENTASSPPFVALGCMFLFLCIPTILMGTTLPILTQIMTRLNSKFMSVVSALYCFNTLGASLGAFVGAYLLISFWGLDLNVYCAALINLVLVGVIASLIPKTKEEKPVESEPVDPNNLGKYAYLCVFLSGFIAIAYEIVWFRTVELFVKASPYAFATVLTVYLLGIALGSWGMNRILAWNLKFDKKVTFYTIQCLIAVYSLVSYSAFYHLAKGPMAKIVKASFWEELHPSFSTSVFHSFETFKNGWFVFFDFLIWPVLFMLVPTILMGASFPLISQLARTESGDEGKTVGNVYFYNIVGNVTGGLVAGFVFLQWLGMASSILVLAVMSIPFLMLLVKQLNSKTLKAIAVGLTVVIVGVTYKTYPSKRAFVESIHVLPGPGWQTFVEEGRDSVIVTYTKDDLVWHYINGLAHGGKQDYMYGFYRRAVDGLTHAKNPAHILIIGYGTGSIVDAAIRCEDVKEITIVELNNSAMVNLKKIPLFNEQLKNPKVELIIDDGRRFLNKTSAKYDGIFMDPLRSSTAYSNNIYSKEFMALAGNHLTDGGVLMVWLDDYVRLPRTVASQFPYARLYSEFCLGSNQPMVENKERRKQILSTFKPAEVEKIETFENYLGDKEFVMAKTAGIPLNTDFRPQCEYYMGLIHKPQTLEQVK